MQMIAVKTVKVYFSHSLVGHGRDNMYPGAHYFTEILNVGAEEGISSNLCFALFEFKCAQLLKANN